MVFLWPIIILEMKNNVLSMRSKVVLYLKIYLSICFYPYR